MTAGYRSSARPTVRNSSFRPAATYFVLTFFISWTGAFLVAAPHLLRGEAVPRFAGLMMFPAMLLGPAISGLALTGITSGAQGMRALLGRLTRIRFPGRWFAILLVPQVLVLATLAGFASIWPAFVPNRFYLGATFGIGAGLLEEIGWSGYAFPALLRRVRPLPAAVILGVLWAFWHLPVINYLGAATPHGAWWLPYFVCFAVAMTAMRILICWVYRNTGSVPAAQLLHASSTAALAVFSPAVSPAQECAWFGVYAVLLWLVVAVVVRATGSELGAPVLAVPAGDAQDCA